MTGRTGQQGVTCLSISVLKGRCDTPYLYCNVDEPLIWFAVVEPQPGTARLVAASPAGTKSVLCGYQEKDRMKNTDGAYNVSDEAVSIVLRACYALSGTDLAYAILNHAVLCYEACARLCPQLTYAPRDVSPSVRYYPCVSAQPVCGTDLRPGPSVWYYPSVFIT
eukprot:3462467-Rhodomonas_salina.9